MDTLTDTLPNKFFSIDEEGFVNQNETRVIDPDLGLKILENLFILPNNSFSSYLDDEQVIIEAFDSPLIVKSIEKTDHGLNLFFNYSYQVSIPLDNFFVDEWDRIHGEITREITSESNDVKQKIPFTFSRAAQEQFFNYLDEFDDDSFVWEGVRYHLHSFLESHHELNSSAWWDQIYTNTDDKNKPQWDLEGPTETLKDMLPRLKLPKSKILILGAGDGHDAAHFAENGHLVTAVDISKYAIERGKKLYGHLSNIKWQTEDLFKLPVNMLGQFDLVYEYTCFCAIDPAKRKDLVKIWNQCLHEQGQIMATFFCMHKRNGPPFGATEWEIRKRLEKNFQFLFWGRWRKSLPRRQGRELFVLAQKK